MPGVLISSTPLMRPLLFLLLLSITGIAQTTSPATQKYPALRVQPSVGTQQRRIGESYRKMMNIHPKMTVEGVSSMKPIPEAEAVMIVITMDTRAKYTEKTDVYLAHAVYTLPLPAVANGARREFNFPESTVSFDSYRDTSNIGGEVYKYFVSAVRDPETKDIIFFETNYPQLAAFCTAHPEKRREYLNLKKGTKLPNPLK